MVLELTADCIYSSPDGQTKCERTRFKDDWCLFHLDAGHSSKMDSGAFYNELCSLIQKGDTNWVGFAFPKNSKLYDLTFNTEVDLKWSVFEDIVINKIICNEKFDMRHAVSKASFHASKAEFNKDANFSDSKFEGNVFFNTAHLGKADFHGCNFHGRASFLGSIAGTGSFHQTIFHEAVSFRGGRDVSISVGGAEISIEAAGSLVSSTYPQKFTLLDSLKKLSVKIVGIVKSTVCNLYNQSKRVVFSIYKTTRNWLYSQQRRFLPVEDSSVTPRWLFDSETQMTEVEFRRPESTKFIGVDMSKVRLSGTDVTGVHFHDVKFYQPSLRRQGLYDEIVLLNVLDFNNRSYMLPGVEFEYRNVRVALENNKNFSAATDFYVGEMEMRLLQMFYPKRYLFSIEAIYKTLSNFGASPVRAIRIFLWLVIIHALLSMVFIDPSSAYHELIDENVQNPLISDPFNTLFIYLANAFQTLTLQRGDAILEISSFPKDILDTAFRVLGPVQIAIIILAIRTKIKRY